MPLELPDREFDEAPLNASLLVGLHNSYHQNSPLGFLVQPWSYAHPSIYDQLKLGYRELEIDVSWKTGALRWRVMHVSVIDAATSCACLSDCLGQIDRWMNEPANKVS
jgi:hypothetical protein